MGVSPLIVSFLAFASGAMPASAPATASATCSAGVNLCTDENGTGSYTLTRQPGDKSDCIWNIHVDFGDGSGGDYLFNGAPLIVSHTYARPGRYTVRGSASGGHSPSAKWTCPDYSVAATVEYPLGEPCVHEVGEVIVGSLEADRLSGSAGGDRVTGLAGDDVVDGGEGSDCLQGEDGLDWLKGGPGGDRLEGGPDADLLDGKEGEDTVDGGAGSDFVVGGGGRDHLTGGGGDDILSDGLGRNEYDAGGGDDIVSARQSVPEQVRCGPGEDVAYLDVRDRPSGCEHVVQGAPPRLAWPQNVTGGEPSSGPRRASSEPPRSLQGTLGSFARYYAPLVYLHPGDRYRPEVANDYIHMAALRWTHAGCRDHVAKSAGTIDPAKLSSRGWHTDPDWSKTPYYHQRARRLCLGHSGRSYSTAEHTRPHDDGVLGSGGWGQRAEGFFLDIPDTLAARNGSDPSTVPVYYECCPTVAGGGHAITYWFFYAYDRKLLEWGLGAQKHEADWERISIRFAPDWSPKSVAYFAHDPAGTFPGYREIPWSNVERVASGNTLTGHPVVYSADGSHASYPSDGTWNLVGVGGWFAKDYAAGPLEHADPWKTWQHVSNATTQAWYGYGGAWGQYFDIGFQSGPLGPGWKLPYPTAWR